MIPAKSRLARLLRLGAAGLCAAALGGCISLVPKTKPAQLYRFVGPSSAQAPAGAPAAEPVGVVRIGGLFQREAAGDRLLTIRGERAAYIAQARWVAPAQILWDEAVLNAFDATPGRVRLMARGEPGHGAFALRLDVRNFEAHYDGRGAPTVLVRVRASLSGDGQARPTERMFEARAPASEDRVTAIVAAYDKALAQILSELVAWTNSAVA